MHECPWCERSYERLGYLGRHITLSHGIPVPREALTVLNEGLTRIATDPSVDNIHHARSLARKTLTAAAFAARRDEDAD